MIPSLPPELKLIATESPSGVDDILEELGKNTNTQQESNYIPTKNIEFMSKKKKNSNSCWRNRFIFQSFNRRFG